MEFSNFIKISNDPNTILEIKYFFASKIKDGISRIEDKSFRRR